MWWSAKSVPLACAVLLLFAACLAGGCGYSMESRQPTVMGDSSKRLKLRNVEQPTLYEWLGPSIRSAMRDEVNARKAATWVDSGDCDFNMDIRVRSFTLRSWLRDASQNTVMYEGKITLEATLYRCSDNAEVWRSGVLSYSESFDADTPDTASGKLTKRLAEKIVRKMRNTF